MLNAKLKMMLLLLLVIPHQLKRKAQQRIEILYNLQTTQFKQKLKNYFFGIILVLVVFGS